MGKHDSYFEETDVGDLKSVLTLSHSLDTRELWKIYGIESEAGKILHKLFRTNPYPKIEYPKPKPKIHPLYSPPKIKKIPKSQTKIEYPSPQTKSISLPLLHPIDMVGHKKQESTIKKEIDDYYKRPPLPFRVGINRKNLIEDTQNKFEKKRGALPKLAELPMIPEDQRRDYDEKGVKERALAKLPQNKIMFLEKKIAMKANPVEDEQEINRKMSPSEEDRELEKLYEMIELEIQERQEFLESISHLQEPQLKLKIRNEILERISELEKIIKLLHKKKN